MARIPELPVTETLNNNASMAVDEIGQPTKSVKIEKMKEIFNTGYSTTVETAVLLDGKVDDSDLDNYYDKPEVDVLLDGKVDDSQVLTNVPSNALFTDTIYTLPSDVVVDADLTNYYDKIETASLLDNKANTSQVLTDVPINALFTDTIYELPSDVVVDSDLTNYIKAVGETRDISTTGGGVFASGVKTTNGSGELRSIVGTDPDIETVLLLEAYRSNSVKSGNGVALDFVLNANLNTGSTYGRISTVNDYYTEDSSMHFSVKKDTVLTDLMQLDAGGLVVGGTITASQAILGTEMPQLQQVEALIDGRELSNAFLHITTPPALTVGPATYASPDGIAYTARRLVGFTYGSSLVCTKAGWYMIATSNTLSNNTTNTTTNIYVAKNWAGGAPSTDDLQSLVSRETDPTDKGNVGSRWLVELAIGDSIDLVLNADNSSVTTLLTGTIDAVSRNL